MTGPDTAGQLRTRAATWRQRRPTSPAPPTRWISTAVPFVHGAQDRIVPSSHATWLARRCRTAELWLRPDDGHVSILNSSVKALDWLRHHASHR
jgi:pimeloyl-ACP methyl ester carboxylesterase